MQSKYWQVDPHREACVPIGTLAELAQGKCFTNYESCDLFDEALQGRLSPGTGALLDDALVVRDPNAPAPATAYHARFRSGTLAYRCYTAKDLSLNYEDRIVRAVGLRGRRADAAPLARAIVEGSFSRERYLPLIRALHHLGDVDALARATTHLLESVASNKNAIFDKRRPAISAGLYHLGARRSAAAAEA
ncbi:MAG: hypothetical protein AAGA56_18750 [Myxococcota bacterium]